MEIDKAGRERAAPINTQKEELDGGREKEGGGGS